MAVVVKRQTVVQKKREDALVVKHKLQKEIEKIKQENKKEIMKQSLIWMTLLGAFLFFIFPLGFVGGWFIGREYALRKLCKEQRRQLERVNEKIKLQLGEAGENKVSDTIETLLPDNFLLLNDLVIPNGRNGTQIDHVLIGLDKIYCIETKDITGKFYPHKDGWLWYPTSSRGEVRKKTVVKNPQHQSIYHANHLKKLIESHGYSVEVKPVVILTNPYGEWKGRQDKRCPIFRVKDFIEYVAQEKEVKITVDTKEKIAKFLSESDQKYSATFYDQFETM
ncbi:nuclease-related domain-containing protein [Fredinandcohnia onubensis]|uniref:nuclease-related domain-containing protein n=1 Tax=Fredinandcohnia onubensis TaxID=1571209 RepID=UPI000C0BF8D4|nr:nuclease-related domain-containing protein [Fredinandcohnia onubensis]